jgi:hypothetical protein
MGVVLSSLRSLIQGKRGRLDLKADGGNILAGTADAVEDLKTQGRTVITESWPGTAVDTLPQWHDTLGVAYDPTARSIAEQQTMLAAMETAVGGSTLAKLQAQLDKEFFGRIVVSEAYVIGIVGQALCGLARCGLASPIIYAYGYNVTGTVYSSTEAARVVAILQRYAPAHLQPNSLLTDLSATAVGLVGIARVGIARVGKAS